MEAQRSAPPIEKPASTMLGRIVGFVISVFGVTLVTFVVWVLYRLWKIDRLDQLFGWVLISVCGMIAVFCLLVGVRLLLNRPNRHGSLLSPGGWRIVGGVFCLVAAGLVLGVVVYGMYQFILTPLLAAGFGVMCFRAASRLTANAKN